MPTEEIIQKVSERYAKAATSGEQMCCPTSYDMGHLKTFIPEEVLKISYGCGTPAGLKTVRRSWTSDRAAGSIALKLRGWWAPPAA